MFYPQEIIDEVIQANNIVEIIGTYVNLTKKGNTFFGLCPFHNEKTPSFSVTDNGNKQMFYCFGCHKGGSVLTFLMEYEGLTYTEALNNLADRAHITLPKPDYSKAQSEKYKQKEDILAAYKDAAVYFYRLLKSEKGSFAYKYLRNRGLSDETIRNYGLGYSDKYRDDLYKYLKSKGYSDEIINSSGLVKINETDTHDYFWNRVMFPIMDTSNRVIAFGGRVMGNGEPKYLNSPETSVFEKNRTLYGLNVAKKFKGKAYILCEGYMDVISLHQAGFTNAVASLGTAFTDNHASVLKRYTDRVVISYDSDTAGQDAALRAIPKLRAAGILTKVADLTPYKDPDELIKAVGSDEYTRRLESAINSFIFEIHVLQRSFNILDPEEKSRFGNEICNRLSYFSDELERENFLKTICAEYDFDYNIMKSKVIKLALGHEGINKNPEINLKSDKKVLTADSSLDINQKMLLAYLAGEPSLFDRLSQYVEPEDFVSEPYKSMVVIMFRQLEKGQLIPASIISSFEDPNDQQLATEVLYYSIDSVSDEEKKKSINDCVIRLKKHHIELLLDKETDAGKMIELRKLKESFSKLSLF